MASPGTRWWKPTSDLVAMGYVRAQRGSGFYVCDLNRKPRDTRPPHLVEADRPYLAAAGAARAELCGPDRRRASTAGVDGGLRAGPPSASARASEAAGRRGIFDPVRLSAVAGAHRRHAGRALDQGVPVADPAHGRGQSCARPARAVPDEAGRYRAGRQPGLLSPVRQAEHGHGHGRRGAAHAGRPGSRGPCGQGRGDPGHGILHAVPGPEPDRQLDDALVGLPHPPGRLPVRDAGDRRQSLLGSSPGRTARGSPPSISSSA